MCNQTHTNQDQSRELFEAFPAPRGWQFGREPWTGSAPERDTTDYLPSQPITSIEISIIRNASVR